MDRLTFTVQSLRPDVKAVVPPGAKLFISVNRRNFNRRLKAALCKLSVAQAARYSPHAFRLGSAQEMNETGSPISVIASAGSWRSNAVRGYIDLSANVERNVRQRFRADIDSESEKQVPPSH